LNNNHNIENIETDELGNPCWIKETHFRFIIDIFVINKIKNRSTYFIYIYACIKCI